MSGSASKWRGWAVSVALALLGSTTGCIEAPEPLELELVIDDEDTVMRAAPPATAPEPGGVASRWPAPDHEAWPLSDDPRLAALGQRVVRTYPQWPTPIDEPCPAVMFGSFEPQLDGGDMFERVSARLAAIGPSRLGLTPTELTLVHDHIDVPGLRLVAASDTRGSCMMGWSHTHCFVTATDAYCPDGTSGDLERLVRAHALTPAALSTAAWIELAVVMSGAERLVVEPRLVRECTRVLGVEALEPTVEMSDQGLTVRFTAITDGEGIDYTVRFERDGGVTLAAETRWPLPPSDEEVWGEAVGEPFAG